MLVYHLTKDGAYHRWAFVPFDDSNVPFAYDNRQWNFVWPQGYSASICVGPEEYTTPSEDDVSYFTLYRFTLKRPPSFYLEYHWAIRADQTAKNLLENDLVASYPYARSMEYG